MLKERWASGSQRSQLERARARHFDARKEVAHLSILHRLSAFVTLGLYLDLNLASGMAASASYTLNETENLERAALLQSRGNRNLSEIFHGRG